MHDLKARKCSCLVGHKRIDAAPWRLVVFLHGCIVMIIVPDRADMVATNYCGDKRMDLIYRWHFVFLNL
jgi:hypothetical protein